MLFGRCNIISIGRPMAKAAMLIAFIAAALCATAQHGFAAIGCTLSNPAADLKYLYPEMTTYKEDLQEFTRMKEGQQLFASLRERLGTDLDPLYETYDTPYTVYSVFKGQKKIGVVHGVNVPGKGGVIQVFLSLDPERATIRRFFFQRLESPAADQLRSKEFRKQFESLTLADFYKHDYYAAVEPGASADRVGKIKVPALQATGRPDYEATIRGIRKNLILLDFFVYGRRFEPFFDKAKQALQRKATKG